MPQIGQKKRSAGITSAQLGQCIVTRSACCCGSGEEGRAAPQLGQNAIPSGTSAWQAGQTWLSAACGCGCGAEDRAAPQLGQNAIPSGTSAWQAGQTWVSAACCGAEGRATPQLGQNAIPSGTLAWQAGQTWVSAADSVLSFGIGILVMGVPQDGHSSSLSEKNKPQVLHLLVANGVPIFKVSASL